MSDTGESEVLSVLPLKDTVLFPYVIVPITVGREGSMAAVRAALAGEEKRIFVVAEKEGTEDPNPEHLYRMGTIAVIKKMSNGREPAMQLLVLGTDRAEVVAIESCTPCSSVRVKKAPLEIVDGPEVEALRRAVLALAARVGELADPSHAIDLHSVLSESGDAVKMLYLLASIFGIELQKEQAILEAKTEIGALEILHAHLANAVQMLELKAKLSQSVHDRRLTGLAGRFIPAS